MGADRFERVDGAGRVDRAGRAGRADRFERWSALHGGARATGLVGGWLRIVYAVAEPLARRRVPPDLVTALGLILAGLALLPAGAGGRWPLLAALLIALSGLVDGLDGAVAVLSDRVTAWGAVLDAGCDRLADVCCFATLWRAGAPAGWCVAAAVLALVHEQVRATARAHGMTEIGVVTISERPTRLIIAAAFLLAAAVYPHAASTWLTVGAVTAAAVALIALTQLTVATRHRLSVSPASSTGAGE
jgi:CDP-diacylglycerol--glycerol-3-phosphate 3-phosphatidyltransferase